MTATPNPLLDLAARHMPPPEILALPLRICPPALERRVLETALNQLLREMLEDGEFDYLEGKRLAIEISDMNLKWLITSRQQRLVAEDEAESADAVIRGRAVEFLLLAGRLEDPDTLFFQRRLEVSGDTVIGLTTRNLLDRLPIEDLPLALRILLNRAARFARRIRSQRTAG